MLAVIWNPLCRWHADGSELAILQSIDWAQFRFDLITVAHHRREPHRIDIRDFLKAQGYALEVRVFTVWHTLQRIPLRGMKPCIEVQMPTRGRNAAEAECLRNRFGSSCLRQTEGQTASQAGPFHAAGGHTE